MPDLDLVPPSYVRTQGGAMVHKADGCRYSKGTNAYPWDWADGKTVSQVVVGGVMLGITYRWCRICFPGGGTHA